MIKRFLVVCVFFLLVISFIGFLSFGNNVKLNEKEIDRYLYPEFYDCYNTSDMTGYGSISGHESNYFIDSESEETNIVKETPGSLNGPPMDSPWPMYCHDIRHTGRSPYSTADNSFYNKWWIKSDAFIEGSGVIDNDGVIYFGFQEENYDLYLIAVYPNGTLKWKCLIDGFVKSSPTIDEDGNIYVGIYYHWDGVV